MADPDADEQRSARLLTALVWGGVALAPIAVLVALIGGGDASLRFAVLLLAVAIVLIGSSMLIRNDPTLLRLDIDDRLAQGIEAVREEMRDEIAAAARATHHRVQTLQDDIVRFQSQRPPAAAQAQRPPAAAQAQRPPAAAPQAQRPPAVPAQRAPGTTTGAVRAPGTTSGAVRVPGTTSGSVPVARAAAAVPPRPHVPPQAPPQLPPPQLPAPERDYPESDYPEPDYGQETGRRADRRIPADRPIKTDRHAKSDSGRRARRRRAADEDDGYQVIPPMSPDRYESDRYGPDPQPASGRRAAPEGDRDDYPRW